MLGFFAAPPAAAADPFPELTPREREVLDLIAAGLSNTAIAARLGLAAKTVANHVSTIFTKLASPTAPTPSSGPAKPASAPRSNSRYPRAWNCE